MGLNDDVDEGLEITDAPDFDPDLPIPKPVVIQPDISAVDENPVVTDQDLFGTDIVKNEVPNLNAKFLLTVEQSNRTLDLIEVKKVIQSSNGICKEDAELIESNAPGFINDKKPLGFFTETKSRTQFNESMNSLDQTIDSNLGTITQQAKDAATQSCSKLMPLLKDLPNKVTQVTSTLQNEISTLIDFVCAKGLDNGFAFGDGSTIRDVLYRPLKNGGEPEDIEHSDADIKLALKNIIAFAVNPSCYNNMLCLFLPMIDPGNEKTIFSAGTSYSFYEVSGKAPYLAVPDKEEQRKLQVNLTIYETLTCAVDASALESIKRLLGACTNIMGDVGTSVEEINTISAEDTADHSSKLNRIVAINGANTKNTLFVFFVIAYIEEYVAFLHKLKQLLVVCSNKMK